MADYSRVAPELRSVLEVFPEIDFSQGIAPHRDPAAARPPLPTPPALEVVRQEQRTVPGVAGEPDAAVLLYTPPGAATGLRPAVLHIHGGGFVIGDAATFGALCRATALTHDCVVISVDYRLAPETRWPGALKDCYAALCWMHASAAELGIDPARIVVMGESAGGGHAAALALHAREQGGPAICFLLMDAPMLDDRTGTTSDPHPHVGHFIWTPEMNRFGWTSLLGVEAGGPDVPAAAVPARAQDLSGLPPTFISVGALDLFLEEDIEWVRRLTRAGVAAELHVIPGAYHGFGFAASAPQVEQVSQLRTAALNRVFSAQSG